MTCLYLIIILRDRQNLQQIEKRKESQSKELCKVLGVPKKQESEFMQLMKDYFFNKAINSLQKPKEIIRLLWAMTSERCHSRYSFSDELKNWIQQA